MSATFTFLIVLIALFIIAGIIIGISMARSRNRGLNVPTETDPIPDAGGRNPSTRRDSTVR